MLTSLTSLPQGLSGPLPLQNRNIAKIGQCRVAERCPKTRGGWCPVPVAHRLQGGGGLLEQEKHRDREGDSRKAQEGTEGGLGTTWEPGPPSAEMPRVLLTLLATP